MATVMLGPAMAGALTINTYTDETAWQADAGAGLLLENFNDETANVGGTSLGFDGFTATHTNGNAMRVEDGGDADNINGTKFLQFNSPAYTQDMVWTFDDPFSALGFDWRNTDTSADDLELIVDAQSFTFGPASQSGFFGIVITGGVVTQVAISDTAGGGSSLIVGSFDDVQFNVIPGPSSIVLIGSCLAGLIAFSSYRNRHRDDWVH